MGQEVTRASFWAGRGYHRGIHPRLTSQRRILIMQDLQFAQDHYCTTFDAIARCAGNMPCKFYIYNTLQAELFLEALRKSKGFFQYGLI